MADTDEGISVAGRRAPQSSAFLRDMQSAVEQLMIEREETGDIYAETRAEMERSLANAGIPAADADNLIESFEREWLPKFGIGSSLTNAETGRRPWDPMMRENGSARSAWDAAVRENVPPDLFERFTANLRKHREVESTASRMSENLYSLGGAESIEEAAQDVKQLRLLRHDIMDELERMAPNMSVSSKRLLAGGDKGAEAGHFDPIRRTVSIALDASGGRGLTHARREMLRTVWPTLEEMMSDEERKVADDHVRMQGIEPGTPEARRRLMNIFVDYAAPDGRKKPGRGSTGTIWSFLEKAANLARGRGFINAEAIWKRAANGELGRRQNDEHGVRATDRNKDAFRASLAKTSNIELARMIDEQDAAVRDARMRMADRRRRLFVLSAPARTLRRAVNYFSSRSRDPLRAEQKDVGYLAQGRVMLMAELRRRQQTRSDNAAGYTAPDPSGPGRPGPHPPEYPNGPIGMARTTGRDDHSHLRLIASNDEPGAHIWAYAGQSSDFCVRMRDGHTAVMMSTGAGAQSVNLGSFRDVASAALYAGEMDAAAQTGSASVMAQELARRASKMGGGADMKDIDLIRNSGLLDKRLDEAIERQNVMAFAYPLKTGDIIWETAPGQWQVGNLNDLKRFAVEHATPGMAIAAEALHDEAVMRARDSRIWLNVPLADEPQAQTAGAVYDGLEERWYAPTEEIRTQTRAWWIPEAQDAILSGPQGLGEAFGELTTQNASKFSNEAIRSRANAVAEVLAKPVVKTTPDDARWRITLRNEAEIIKTEMGRRGMDGAALFAAASKQAKTACQRTGGRGIGS